MMRNQKLKMVATGVVLCFWATIVQAQTTMCNYQGRLAEMGNPVTGNRLFQFKLYDENGVAIPGAVSQQTLSVINGVFNTTLDFGAANFSGANRSLEIAVKINAGDPYTVLTPRQPIFSVPYSIKSQLAATADTAGNAAQLGGVAATRYVQQDAGGNVSIAGGLTVAGTFSLTTINAQTQYNLGGQRLLSNAGTNNLFVGVGAGAANTTGDRNSFLGSNAGQANTTGAGNTFIGESAGLVNLQGSFNAFVGESAGRSNTTGNENAYFGNSAGRNNTTGLFNVFLGTNAGFSNTTGNFNTLVGRNAGLNNNADNNAFYGNSSGQANTTGSGNAFFGASAGLANSNGGENSFFGSFAGLSNTTGQQN